MQEKEPMSAFETTAERDAVIASAFEWFTRRREAGLKLVPLAIERVGHYDVTYLRTVISQYESYDFYFSALYASGLPDDHMAQIYGEDWQVRAEALSASWDIYAPKRAQRAQELATVRAAGAGVSTAIHAESLPFDVADGLCTQVDILSENEALPPRVRSRQLNDFAKKVCSLCVHAPKCDVAA